MDGGGVEVPAWRTVTDCPATFNVPVRVPWAVFAATLKVTALMPDPDPALVMVIHVTVLAALHLHEVPLVTLSVRLVPSVPTAKLVGVTV